ncbi:MAG: tetratricopeptide repeat protein [Methanospirillum sp.]|nr:tetratricopeptide repeat protein [Methanospirillum sp.]
MLIICLITVCCTAENSSEINITPEDLLQENDLILSQDPGNITALQYRALIFFNDAKYPEAINVSEQCLAINESCAFAWRIIGSSWGFLHQPEKAREAFRNVVRLSPDDPAQYNIQGVALSRTDQYPEAIQSFQKAIDRTPGYAVAWNNMGVTYLAMNDTEKALDAFTKAISLQPDEPVYYSNKGYAYLKRNDLGGALAMGKTARQLDMTCVPAWFVSGDAQYLDRNWKEAFYSYDGGFNALQNSETWYFQGSEKTRITKGMEPVEAYFSAIASNIRFDTIWERTTVIQHKIQRYQNTLDLFDQIIAITPDYGNGWKRKEVAAVKIERFESAKDAGERALTFYPNDPEILSTYGYSLGKLGDFIAAMKYIDKAIELEPGYARAYLYKGLVNSFYGQRNDAITALQKGLEYDPHNGELFDALSDIQMKNGDTLGGIINKIRGIIGF